MKERIMSTPVETYVQRSFTDSPDSDYGLQKTTAGSSSNGGIDSLAVNCDSQFSFHYEIPVLCLCVLCFLTGLAYSFFGYRFSKAVLFVTGLMFGSVLVYLVCDKEKLLPKLGKAGVALCGGIVFGLVTMLVEYVGVFMNGFLSGLFLGCAIMLVLYFAGSPFNLWLTIGMLFVSGLVLALMTLKWKKLFLVLGTALIGGAMVATSLDYVAHNFGIVKWVWSVLSVDSVLHHNAVCWYGWLVFSLWPFIFVLGTGVQWKLTSVGVSRKKQGSQNVYRTRGSSVVNSGVAERRRTPDVFKLPSTKIMKTEQSDSSHNTCHLSNEKDSEGWYQPKPYRQLYQARRNRGDVICQGYMENFQKQQHEHTSLSSDYTRTTDPSSVANSFCS